MAERETPGTAALPPTDDADELTRLRRELATARAEQASTASILRAIASGPARHLSKMMGGDVNVIGIPGTGSTFTVHLPADRVGDGSGESTNQEARS
jgi:hypothetical protein